MIYAVWTLIFVGVLGIVFFMGRKYERKQFVKIGTKRPTTQDILLGGKK